MRVINICLGCPEQDHIDLFARLAFQCKAAQVYISYDDVGSYMYAVFLAGDEWRVNLLDKVWTAQHNLDIAEAMNCQADLEGMENVCDIMMPLSRWERVKSNKFNNWQEAVVPVGKAQKLRWKEFIHATA